jgi:hypothetical protein
VARLRSGLGEHGGVGYYLLNGVVVRLVPFTVRHHANRALRALLAFVLRFGSVQTYRLVSRSVIALARHRAFGDLPAAILPMAVWLFISDDPWHALPDLGWGGRCQELHRIAVGGTHKTVLLPPARDVVIAKLARLEVALRAQRRKNKASLEQAI